jgi:hypothetical protein
MMKNPTPSVPSEPSSSSSSPLSVRPSKQSKPSKPRIFDLKTPPIPKVDFALTSKIPKIPSKRRRGKTESSDDDDDDDDDHVDRNEEEKEDTSTTNHGPELETEPGEEVMNTQEAVMAIFTNLQHPEKSLFPPEAAVRSGKKAQSRQAQVEDHEGAKQAANQGSKRQKAGENLYEVLRGVDPEILAQFCERLKQEKLGCAGVGMETSGEVQEGQSGEDVGTRGVEETVELEDELEVGIGAVSGTINVEEEGDEDNQRMIEERA